VTSVTSMITGLPSLPSTKYFEHRLAGTRVFRGVMIILFVCAAILGENHAYNPPPPPFDLLAKSFVAVCDHICMTYIDKHVSNEIERHGGRWDLTTGDSREIEFHLIRLIVHCRHRRSTQKCLDIGAGGGVGVV
jgi:hypothetical protein